ncbi:MAG: recombinase family protein [Sporichthyaceae bacterium]|nr:recombinase family protein [Sporichthyaceae bacterium]
MAAFNPQPMIVAYPHVALYTRISKDKYGNAETCFDQEALGRRYAETVWPGVPVVVYSDPDLSAFEDDVYRPGYEALKEAIRAGLVLHLWTVEQTRLERQEVPWFQMAALLDAAGIELLHTHRDGMVRVQDEVAGIKAVLAASEVRKMKRRIADKFDAQAARGVPPGSRPYGYVHGRLANGDRTYVIVPAQAEVIREAAGLVLDGWSLENIARRLRDRGIHGAHRVKVRDGRGEPVTDEAGRPVTRPSEITGATVRGMLTNRAVAGINVRREVEVGDGNWTPILERSTWRVVRAKLSGDRQVSTVNGRTYLISDRHRGRSPGRRYLLTGGRARCGVCTAELVGSQKQLRNKSRGVYTVPYLLCHPKTGGRACVGIMAMPTEEFVIAELFDEIRRRGDDKLIDDGAVGARREQLTTALTDIDEQRKDLARMWATKQLNGVEWAEARSALDTEQHQLETHLRMLPTTSEAREPAAILSDWAVMTLDERREVIDDYIDQVIIMPARPGLQRFDPDRVKVSFRQPLHP